MKELRVILNFQSAFTYLNNRLSDVIDDDEAISALFNLIVKEIVDFRREWGENSHFVQAISWITETYDIGEAISLDIITNTEAMVMGEVLQHLPHYGHPKFYRNVRIEFMTPCRVLAIVGLGVPDGNSDSGLSKVI